MRLFSFVFLITVLYSAPSFSASYQQCALKSRAVQAGYTCITSKGKTFQVMAVYTSSDGKTQEIWKDLTAGIYWSHDLGAKSHNQMLSPGCVDPVLTQAMYDLNLTSFIVPFGEFYNGEEHGFREALPGFKSYQWWTPVVGHQGNGGGAGFDTWVTYEGDAGRYGYLSTGFPDTPSAHLRCVATARSRF